MVGGRRRDIGLGGFPDVTLKDARTRAREAKDQIRKGIDPVAERKAARAALMTDRAKEMTFAEAARQCHAAKVAGFANAKHKKDWISSLERYAFKEIGTLPIGDIELPHVLGDGLRLPHGRKPGAVGWQSERGAAAAEQAGARESFRGTPVAGRARVPD